MVGFGIKDAATAAKISGIADGVVIGSAIVKLIAAHEDDLESATSEIVALLSGMRASMDESSTVLK